MNEHTKNNIINHGTINRHPISRKTGKHIILPRTEFGEGTIVCHDAVVYSGSKIGKNCFIADGASIREGCIIGDNVLIGRMSVIEQDVRIGDNVKINSNVHITGNMRIGNDCFFGPFVSTMNDTYMGIYKDVKLKGPHLSNNVYVGGGATILPGVYINHHVVIGAGALITDDINHPYTVWGSKPAVSITHKVNLRRIFPDDYKEEK